VIADGVQPWERNTGDVDEADGRARETRENMAKN